MQLKPLGLVVTAVALLLPIIWLPELAAKHDTVALFSQYLGMAALIAMALSQIIATRFSFVEWIFGGLDRGYILHKWLGIGAMIAILLHDTIDAEMDGLGRETLLVEIAETAGEISLYGLLILVVITIATFIPYHLWRWTHRIMGGFFVLGAFHYLFILKPFSNGDPLALYVSTFCILGILAFGYKLLPPSARIKHRYTVTEIRKAGNVSIVTMSPQKRALKYRAGQFAFVTFEAVMGTEPHPFTVSNAPDNSGDIQMTIADLGDYTRKLQNKLSVGAEAMIEGPFGRFERRSGSTPEIWIAAGIGITPFVAWAQNLQQTDSAITLYYCVKTEKHAVHLATLEEIANQLPSFSLVLHCSQQKGRLDPAQIAKSAGLDEKTKVYFCGPKSMRNSVFTELKKFGLSNRRFHFEEFEIRSGIGLRKLAGVLLERLR